MLKNLAEKIKGMMGERIVFDPSGLNDHVAIQTAWTPLKGGGSNFRTHKLIEVGFERVEFRASVGAKIFSLLFLFVGVGLNAAFAYSMYEAGNFSFNSETVVPMIIGLIFAIVGGAMLYFGTTPIVFDRGKGYFWKGRKKPDEFQDNSNLKNFAMLEQIHALQIISEYCRGSKSSFYSYELNLVLKNGKRINVVDHGNFLKLREDAQKLSGFLNRPVWDTISGL